MREFLTLAGVLDVLKEGLQLVLDEDCNLYCSLKPDACMPYSLRYVGTAHLNCEINMAWCVDDVDLCVTPPCICCSTLDGDALLALQLHAVHLGTHTIPATHLCKKCKQLRMYCLLWLVSMRPRKQALARDACFGDARVENSVHMTIMLIWYAC